MHTLHYSTQSINIIIHFPPYVYALHNIIDYAYSVGESSLMGEKKVILINNPEVFTL